ncbi:MAG TPA: hypothetical protein VGE01_04390 [Fimbriimonas sp.]
MIVVKKEDAAKVALLSVALVCTLGFVGYRTVSMLGDGAKPVVASATAPGVAAEAAPVTGNSIGGLQVFAGTPAPNEPNPFREVLVLRQDSNAAPLPKPGSLPGVGFGGGVEPMPVGTFDIKPVEVAQLRLDGVVAGRSGAAIVSMGDRTDVLTVGQSIGPYTVLSIKPNAATFSRKGGPVRLLVGEQTKPPAPPAVKLQALPASLPAAMLP